MLPVLITCVTWCCRLLLGDRDYDGVIDVVREDCDVIARVMTLLALLLLADDKEKNELVVFVVRC